MSNYLKCGMNLSKETLVEVDRITDDKFKEKYGDGEDMTEEHKRQLKISISQKVATTLTREQFFAKTACITTRIIEPEQEQSSSADLGTRPKFLKDVSPKLQEMIDEMMKTELAKPGRDHVVIMPQKPMPGDMVVPTGGLAKCQCSPDCQVELMEPAFRFLANSEDRERWKPSGSSVYIDIKELQGRKNVGIKAKKKGF
ncbi:unnamed protein product [Caenorhabditis brenneri]